MMCRFVFSAYLQENVSKEHGTLRNSFVSQKKHDNFLCKKHENFVGDAMKKCSDWKNIRNDFLP